MPTHDSPTFEPRQLDPRVVNLWRIQGVIQVLVVWLPVLATLGAMAGLLTRSVWLLGLVVPVLIAAFVSAIVLPGFAYRRFEYSVREHDLLVSQGVLFRHTVSVPLKRIQHVDTRQGPVERAWGLSRLVVYTAAGASADGSIPGLDEAEADRLRDVLGRRGGDDGV